MMVRLREYFVLFVGLAWLLSSCQIPDQIFNPTTPAVTNISPGNPLPVVKVLVETSGIYRITAEMLSRAGLGTIVEDATRIEIKERGEKIPFWAQGEGKGLVINFYGEASSSVYSRYRIYWLGDKGALDHFLLTQWQDRPVTDDLASPQLTGPSPENLGKDTILVTLDAEQNSLYVPQVDNGDHWFWVSLPAPGEQELSFSVNHIAQGPASLRLEVWGVTESAKNPDHHLRINVNGETIADQTWDGRGWYTIEAKFDTDLLREGENILKVDALGDTGAAADVTYIDRFEIDYARQAVLEADQIEFRLDDSPLSFSGTGRVSIYDITDSRNALRVAEDLGAGSPFVGQAGRLYLMNQNPGGLLPAGLETPSFFPDLVAGATEAAYLAIAPAALMPPLKPLLDYHTHAGLKATVVPVESIYDQFNYGYPEPVAIQHFVKHAVANWAIPPKFLLLVGDATYDPRGFLYPDEENQIPAEFIQTVYGGETASDLIYTQLNDDPWPDLAVGRIPARTAEQVKDFVEKTVAYEQQRSLSSNEPKIAAVADGQDPSFKLEAQSFLDMFSHYDKQLYAPDAGAAGANTQVAEIMSQGELILGYFGHGSVNMWGKDKLFSTKDIANLHNDQIVPLIINMTCLTGYFTHPKVLSMAEAFLWQPHAGALTVLAPSSLTLPGDQSFLTQAFVDALNSNPDLTVGELHLISRRKIPADQEGSLDVMRTFMLFGDPALRLIR